MTTLVHLQGGGFEGIGEDVVYDGLDHVALQAEGGSLPLAGSYTMASWAEHLAVDRAVAVAAGARRVGAATAAGRSSRPRWTSRCARRAGRCRSCSGASRRR